MAVAHSSPRCVVLAGPHLTGKTTLMERLLLEAGTIGQAGSVTAGTSVGDATPEARARGMSIEINVATTSYLGDRWAILDTPGSVELDHDSRRAITVADAVVVVVDPVPDHALAVAPLFAFLDQLRVPHFIFINKIDAPASPLTEVIAALQEASSRPLVLRELPMTAGGDIVGFVDLTSERAWRLVSGATERVELPEDVKPEEAEARQKMLEAVADHDDLVLAKLLEDQVPTTEEVYQGLTRELTEDAIVPVFIGAADRGLGVTRLWKALRHEAPDVAATRKRLQIPDGAGPLVQSFQTSFIAHAGRLSLVRVWHGSVSDGGAIAGTRVGGVIEILGAQQKRSPEAKEGEVVGLLKVESLRTGELVTPEGSTPPPAFWPAPPRPVYTLAIHAEKRTDEVKLPLAVARLIEEDPALALEQDQDTQQLILAGQGELHLHVALERLKSRQHLPVEAQRPRVPYRETVKKPGKEHSRYKRQSGGHGQFGDVHLDFVPLPRGSGVEFHETIVGGSIPKNFIPAVEEGVHDALQKGPLGFPVVDVSVTLTDGSYHTVDSSDQAFRTAARIGVSEALPKLDPVLLEPVMLVEAFVPREATSKAQRVLTGRRGQLLGFEPAEGDVPRDRISAYVPLAELHDLIVELRSISHGLASFTAKHDHHSELTGKLAERVLQAHAAEAAQSGN